jgi:hypothetical protein
LSAILIAARVPKEEVVKASLSVPESLLLPPVVGSVVMGGLWSSSPAMEREKWERRKEQWLWSSKRLEGERAEVMGLDPLSDTQLYMRSRQQYDDSLLEKKCLSILTTRTIWTRGQGAEKFGSFKEFKVYDVHKKEPWDERITFINPIGMVICPKQEIKVKTSPDWVIRVSIRSAPVSSRLLMGLRYLRNSSRTDHFDVS